MSTRKMYDLSVEHLPPERLELEALDFGSARTCEHDYGVIVFVNQSPHDDEPPWLRAIFDVARADDVYLINFDHDADTDERFETFPEEQ